MPFNINYYTILLSLLPLLNHVTFSNTFCTVTKHGCLKQSNKGEEESAVTSTKGIREGVVTQADLNYTSIDAT